MTTTLTDNFSIKDDFPPVDYDDWRSLVEEALQGAPFERKLVTHTYEGIDVQPLYCRRDAIDGEDPYGFPGSPPFVRGTQPLGAVIAGWDSRPEHAHPDLTVTNRAILEDLEGGATSLLLRLDAAAREGRDPDEPEADPLAGQDGLMVYGIDDLDAALTGVHLNMIGVALDAGAAYLPAAALLVGLWQRRDVAAAEARGAFNADPLGTLARQGHLPLDPDSALTLMANLASWTAEHYPQVTAIGVDTAVYHDAGATAAQDIAFGMGTAVAYLRAMTGGSLDIDQAARQILFRIELGTHHFLALAKLRAARRVWSRIVQACGGSDHAAAMQIHARTSRRVLTRRDPYVNLLRNTVAVFAAGLGGANVITSVPFDALTGLPDEFSRRVARNTVLVLQAEAHLHRVLDPAGGSWYLDRLTAQLADKAWELFQAIERQGGMLAALQSGWIASEIDTAYAPRAKDIARRKEGITGVSEFPNVSESPVTHPAPDPVLLKSVAQQRVRAARQEDIELSIAATPAGCTSDLVAAAAAGATVGQMARAVRFHETPAPTLPPLEPRSFAEPFEELRDASDAWADAHGHRPRVFLANMGPLAHFTARASYAKNFFEAGGFQVIGDEGFADAAAAATAFAQSAAGVAVICSSDKLYPDIVPEVARQLKQSGARTVVLAGFPGDHGPAWEAAGVDRFIFMKCDVLETLRDLLREEGVWNPQEAAHDE